MRQLGASVGLGLTLAACGGTDELAYGVPSTSDSDSWETSDSESFTTSETTETDTDTDTDTDEGTCELPQNEAPGEVPVVISIRNERDVAIYVTPYSSFACNYGKIEIDVDGGPVLWDHAGTYAYDCSTSLCDWGCSDGGAMGFIINPGAEAQVEWGGALWARTQLSAACQDEVECLVGDACDVRTVAEGEYTARVNLSETCPIEDECMACDEGVCEVFFFEPVPGDISESFEASATLPEGINFVIE